MAPWSCKIELPLELGPAHVQLSHIFWSFRLMPLLVLISLWPLGAEPKGQTCQVYTRAPAILDSTVSYEE